MSVYPGNENVGLVSDYEESASESDSETTKDNPCVGICACSCCLIFCVIVPLIAAATSAGYTSCSTTPFVAALPGTSVELPPIHTVQYNEYQWNWFFQEYNVYNPVLSNTTRVGTWRTTKSWYLRGQWAYMPEGWETPLIVAWTPFFSWFTTHTVKHCQPAVEYTLWQNSWGLWRWGKDVMRWHIYNTGEVQVATATHEKSHQYWGFQTPNGWETVITGDTIGGVVIGEMAQTYSSYWNKDHRWLVKDYNAVPALGGIEPFVASFLAVVIG